MFVVLLLYVLATFMWEEGTGVGTAVGVEIGVVDVAQALVVFRKIIDK